MIKHQFEKCPDCEGRGYIPIQMPSGREMGVFTCPYCKDSPKPGYIVKRVEDTTRNQDLTEGNEL